jgi:hypothetical protein
MVVSAVCAFAGLDFNNTSLLSSRSRFNIIASFFHVGHARVNILLYLFVVATVVVVDHKHLSKTRTKHGKVGDLFHKVLATLVFELSAALYFLHVLSTIGVKPIVDAFQVNYVFALWIAGPRQLFIHVKGQKTSGTAVGHLTRPAEDIVVSVVGFLLLLLTQLWQQSPGNGKPQTSPSLPSPDSIEPTEASSSDASSSHIS